jgi:hypothetical protein
VSITEESLRMRHRDRLHTTLAHVALIIVLDLAAIVPVCAAGPDSNGDGAGKPLWPFLVGIVFFTVGIVGLICRWHVRRLVQRGVRRDSGERSDMM